MIYFFTKYLKAYKMGLKIGKKSILGIE